MSNNTPLLKICATQKFLSHSHSFFRESGKKKGHFQKSRHSYSLSILQAKVVFAVLERSLSQYYGSSTRFEFGGGGGGPKLRGGPPKLGRGLSGGNALNRA